MCEKIYIVFAIETWVLQINAVIGKFEYFQFQIPNLVFPIETWVLQINAVIGHPPIGSINDQCN